MSTFSKPALSISDILSFALGAIIGCYFLFPEGVGYALLISVSLVLLALVVLFTNKRIQQ
jgi:uncharacterized membrane protein YoaK (UPF0700 family)